MICHGNLLTKPIPLSQTGTEAALVPLPAREDINQPETDMVSWSYFRIHELPQWDARYRTRRVMVIVPRRELGSCLICIIPTHLLIRMASNLVMG